RWRVLQHTVPREQPPHPVPDEGAARPAAGAHADRPGRDGLRVRLPRPVRGDPAARHGRRGDAHVLGRGRAAAPADGRDGGAEAVRRGRRVIVETTLGRVGYDEASSGIPIVLLHGFPHDRTLWAAQLAAPPAGARLIAPDLPGFGESESAAVPSLDHWADW